MTPVELLRELTFPLRTLSVVLTLVFSTLYVFVATSLIQLGFVFTILGFALLFLFLPVYCRYLLFLLELRAAGRPAPVLSVDMVAPWNNLRLLAPLVVYTIGFIAAVVMFPGLSWPRYLYALILLAILPASLAILAITRSALEGLNPAAIARTIRACGPRYALIPAVVVALASVLLASSAAMPALLLVIAVNYVVVLLFTLTAAILRTKSLAMDIDIGEPVAPDAHQDERVLQKARQKVANHAYGLISRGNREGGFAHIDAWLAGEADAGSASSWFVNEMLSWDSKDAALFYAQPCLAKLLGDADDKRALKLISRCLHEDPRWKPAAKDRAATLKLLERYRREDLRDLLSA